MKEIILDGISRGIFPGAVLCLYQADQPIFIEAYGHRMIAPQKLPMLKDTLFDLASLTKPVATATSVMILAEQGKISLDDSIINYLPEFGREGITIFHLLTHTSGLPAWKPLYLETSDKSEVVPHLGDMPLEYKTGSKVVYSCLGYILLGEMVHKVAGIKLDKFAGEHIFQPLGMSDTFFNPPEHRRNDCAATEDSNSFEKRMTNYRRYNWREGVVVGEVHDENAHFLGGVAGNAGLFSTAPDLVRYCGMIINGGENVLSQDSVKAMTTDQTQDLDEARGIGWIIMPEGILYHSGFTGTAIWIDLKRRSSAILLTNRVHPDATKEGIIELRRKFYREWKG